MLYLAFIFHMHQPYYKNLLTQEADLPWVRLHGIKDYSDMLKILKNYPAIHQTFNLVPSLLEQVEDYANRTIKDKFLELSYKPAAALTKEDKDFLLKNFFSINRGRVIELFPRYYELFLKKEKFIEFSIQDFLDLQVWFNLAWTDPYYRQNMPQLKDAVNKARFFTEEDKHIVLGKQLEILEEIIPGYRQAIESGQVEVTVSPYYHPILPLLYNTNIAKEANLKTILPREHFAHPEDAKYQIDAAVDYFKTRFNQAPQGMWPSEEAVSEHILPLIIQSGIKWIVADEAILFRSLKIKERDTHLLYQPHILRREAGDLNIIFRDRNLSDLIGFVYHKWSVDLAVNDFMGHLNNIAEAFKGKDALVTIAMDGENAWEYYQNDGHDFLNLLYQRISESKNIKTTTPGEYFKIFNIKHEIKHLAAGSWIYGEFSKWMNNPHKAKAWDYLAIARQELQQAVEHRPETIDLKLVWKQMHVLEGSDWYWWYGEDPDGSFDRLFRVHLSNFYSLIGKPAPEYVKNPI